MIHHLARAFFARETSPQASAHRHQQPAAQTSGAADGTSPRPTPAAPVRPRPITPWTAPASCATATPHRQCGLVNGRTASTSAMQRVRISTDPSDARRTVISGRFAEVCAALDRLVHEQEALA